ncbi:helix-turn-helix domain-containing protein [Actinoplanes sp. NPDC000266]
MSVATLPNVPPDPTGAATPQELGRRLRALMTQRRCSVDAVVRRSSLAGTPISRATAHNLIAARSHPRRDTLLAFLRGCQVPPREQIRWLIAYDQIFPEGRTPAPKLSAS